MGHPARLCVSLSALVLVACAGGSADLKDRPCNDGICKLEVTVESCEKGTLAVDPDFLVVKAPNNLEWTIATAGYKFGADGIVVPGPSFSASSVTPNGKKFKIHDSHSQMGDFKYVVTVIRESDLFTCKPLDPVISNQ